MRIGAGDLNPHFFSYGTLWPYTLTAGFGVLYAAGRTLGWFSSLADFELSYFLDQSRFFLVGRVLGASLGVATVAVVYALGCRVGSRGVGLLAAATLAIAPLHVEYSRYLLTDAPVTFAVALSLWLIIRYAEEERPRTIWAPALAVGLATAVKYTAAALTIPLLAAAYGHESRAPVSARLRQVLTATVALGLAFLVATPFALLDATTFLGDLYSRFWHASQGHHGFGPGTNGFAIYGFEVLPRGMGPVATALCGAGLVLFALEAIRRQRVGGGLLLLFVAPFSLAIGLSATPFDRYALPLLPPLCVAAALAADRLALAISGERLAHVARAGVVAAVLLIPSISTAGALADLGKADTRDIAMRWIMARVTPGTAIATEVYGPELPISREELRSRIARLEESSDGQAEMSRQLTRWRRKLGALARSSTTTPSYVVYTLVLGSRIPDLAEIPYSLRQLRALGVRYTILTSTMVERFVRFPDRYPEQIRFYGELRHSGRLVFELHAVDDGCAARVARWSALGLGDWWCRYHRGPSLQIVELP